MFNHDYIVFYIQCQCVAIMVKNACDVSDGCESYIARVNEKTVLRHIDIVKILIWGPELHF